MKTKTMEFGKISSKKLRISYKKYNILLRVAKPIVFIFIEGNAIIFYQRKQKILGEHQLKYPTQEDALCITVR